MDKSPLFNENTNLQNLENKDYLSELVGEGKKYKDVSELAKAYKHLETHTQIIQSENRDFRTQESELMQKTKALEENYNRIVEQLKTPQGVQQQEGKPVTSPLQNEPSAPVTNKDILGPSDLKRIVQEALKEENTLAQRKSNLDVVNAKATEIFGSLEKANEFVQLKAKETGLSLNDLAEVAMKSPKAFFDLVGIKEAEKGAAKVSALKTEVNTKANPVAFGKAPSDDETNWEYYKKLKRENPNLYWRADTQAKIHKYVMEGVMSVPR